MKRENRDVTLAEVFTYVFLEPKKWTCKTVAYHESNGFIRHILQLYEVATVQFYKKLR